MLCERDGSFPGRHIPASTALGDTIPSMGRPPRILLKTATIVSLLLFGVCVFCGVESLSRTRWFGYEAWDGRAAIAMTEDGWVAVSVCSRRHPGFPPASDCF